MRCDKQANLFLAITGMRDGSALGLLWSDLYLGEVKPYIYIQANNNKTRKYVKITISNTLRDKLRAFKEEQKQFCRKHNTEFSDDMNVFNVMHEYKYPKEDGTTGVIYPSKSFRKSWNTMIKQCSFYKEGEDYAPYRIRHYKITSLMAKKELSAEQIAKYCCTSPDMIKDFYDATETLDFCEEFAEAEKIVEYNKGNDDITSDNDDFQTDECKIYYGKHQSMSDKPQMKYMAILEYGKNNKTTHFHLLQMPKQEKYLMTHRAMAIKQPKMLIDVGIISIVIRVKIRKNVKRSIK